MVLRWRRNIFLLKGAEVEAYKVVRLDRFLNAITIFIKCLMICENLWLARKEQHKLLDAMKSNHTIHLELLSI